MRFAILAINAVPKIENLQKSERTEPYRRVKSIHLSAAIGSISVACLLAASTKAGASLLNPDGTAPASIAGDAFLFSVTEGSGFYSTNGYYLLLTRNSGSSYQVIGVDGDADSSGTYTYSVSDNAGNIIFSDATFGRATNNLVFQTDSPGEFVQESGTNKQAGSFLFANGSAPASLAGRSYYVSVLDGAPPFINQGTAIFSPSPTDNTYNVFGTSPGVLGTSGTYSYVITNTSTGFFVLSDSVSGDSSEYFGFTSPTTGIYLDTQPYSGGFQVGTFTVSNYVPSMFFLGQQDLSDGREFLQFPSGAPFGYYNVMQYGFPLFYHDDLGYEWYIDAQDGGDDCYLYDFASDTWFYTGTDLFPFMYDFTLDAWLYYFPDTNRPDHYTSNPRYFYNFATDRVITK